MLSRMTDAATIQLYAFRYRDARSGRWVCAPATALLDGRHSADGNGLKKWVNPRRERWEHSALGASKCVRKP